MEGYLPLREASAAGDPKPLLDFHHAAARPVAPKARTWQAPWRAGPLAAAHRTGEHLTALAFADQTHLTEATVTATTPSRRSGYGMRGRRDEYALDGTTLPYGGE